jgi:hypothetical protein
MVIGDPTIGTPGMPGSMLDGRSIREDDNYLFPAGLMIERPERTNDADIYDCGPGSDLHTGAPAHHALVPFSDQPATVIETHDHDLYGGGDYDPDLSARLQARREAENAARTKPEDKTKPVVRVDEVD